MRMSGALVASAIIAAMGGFLFGFDTVVISGAEQKIQSLWRLDDALHGLAISAALWGTVLGSLVGSWPTDRFGRKPTLLLIGVLYTVSAVWSAVAGGVYAFAFARFLGGIGVGVSTVAAPLYITEIAPPAFRGRLTGMFQFNIVFGILIAFVSNWLLRGVGESDWRWMLAVAAVPATAYTLLCLIICESPRWLISVKGDRAAGLAVLRKVNPAADAAELELMADAIGRRVGEETANGPAATPFWSRHLWRPISLAFLVAMFNQLSGINAILYFAPRILGMAGLDANAAFIQSIGIGLTNLIFTMSGLWLIDRIGRRTLLYIGSIGYIVSLGLISVIFINNDSAFRRTADALAARDSYTNLADALREGEQSSAQIEAVRESAAKSLAALNATLTETPSKEAGGPLAATSTPEEVLSRANAIVDDASSQTGLASRLLLAGLFLFIASHAIGQGTVIWVLISEVFPNEHRAAGQSLGSATHWIFAALLTLVFPAVVTAYSPGHVFAFFCAMMVLQLVWVALMVPETKGIALEELQAQLYAN